MHYALPLPLSIAIMTTAATANATKMDAIRPRPEKPFIMNRPNTNGADIAMNFLNKLNQVRIRTVPILLAALVPSMYEFCTENPKPSAEPSKAPAIRMAMNPPKYAVINKAKEMISKCKMFCSSALPINLRTALSISVELIYTRQRL